MKRTDFSATTRMAMGQILGILGLAAMLSAAPAMAGGSVDAGKAKANASGCGGCHGMDGNSMIPANPSLAGQNATYITKQLKDFKSGKRANPIMAGMAAALSDNDMQNIGAFYAAQTAKKGAAQDEKLARKGERLYRGGNAKTGVAACMGCHGPAGKGVPPRYPSVSGQHAGYSSAQLKAFKDGQRKNDEGVMTGIAFRMSLEEIQAVSEYMSGLN